MIGWAQAVTGHKQQHEQRLGTSGGTNHGKVYVWRVRELMVCDFFDRVLSLIDLVS